MADDFYDGIEPEKDYASVMEHVAALAASLFHFNELKISDLKEYLDQRGISVRR